MHLFSKVVVAVCILLVTCNPVVEAHRISNLVSEKLVFQNHHFKRLNKRPVKSIKSPDDDIIDCVHIAHQPAFDHPLLKNHTIQMRPNYYPEGVFATNKAGMRASKPIIQLWHLKGHCPKGTIPIRRTKKDYIHKSASIRPFRMMKHHTISQSRSIHNASATNRTQGQFAMAYMEGGNYFGAKATINIWTPKVQQSNELSSSQIWIQGGHDNLNSIEVGWQVDPSLYNDNNTRFFTFWINDLYENLDCYDLRCPGFIQINNNIALGGTMHPISTYHGSQYEFTVSIWQDPTIGHWWLNWGNTLNLIGYWPRFLFPLLHEGASTIIWGGEIVNLKSDGRHTTTQMGSGHFPTEAFRGASYFRNIKYVDVSNFYRNPKDAIYFASQPSCYDIKNGTFLSGDDYFFYGGPGRNPNCP